MGLRYNAHIGRHDNAVMVSQLTLLVSYLVLYTVPVNHTTSCIIVCIKTSSCQFSRLYYKQLYFSSYSPSLFYSRFNSFSVSGLCRNVIEISLCGLSQVRGPVQNCWLRVRLTKNTTKSKFSVEYFCNTSFLRNSALFSKNWQTGIISYLRVLRKLFNKLDFI